MVLDLRLPLALAFLACCAQHQQQAPPSPPAAGAAPSATARNAAAATFDHSALDALLKRHVRDGRVDYAALKQERAALDGYVDRLAQLPAAELSTLARDEQLAFWIDAYNALTLQTIVAAYPIAPPDRAASGADAAALLPRSSIRQIGDAWTRPHVVAGAARSLDDVENKVLRPQFKEPRIHAAINCASLGCPPLRAEAFVGARLDAQLEEQMRRFLADPARNTVDAASKKVELSSVFDWFGDDFGRKDDPRALLAFVAEHGAPEWKPFLAAFDPKAVKFREWDWTLNDVAR